jgi:hypothetical protein
MQQRYKRSVFSRGGYNPQRGGHTARTWSCYAVARWLFSQTPVDLSVTLDGAPSG